MKARRRLVMAGMVLGSVLAAPRYAEAQAPMRRAHDAERRCRVAGSQLLPIQLPGHRQVYVEPQAFAAAGNRLLLAGQPTYLWRMTNGVVAYDTSEAVFGVVMDPEGHGTIVPPPIDERRVRAVRVLGRTDGAWDVTFAEVTPITEQENAESRVKAYWFGVTDGTRWRQLVRLPAVPGRLEADEASDIVATDAATAIAVPFIREGPSHQSAIPDDIAVYTQTGERWALTVIPTRNAGDPALGPSSSGGFLLGIVRPDQKLSHDRNSLFLMERGARDTVWRDRSRIVLGQTSPVHDPEFSLDDAGLVVSFTTSGVLFGPGTARVLFQPDTGETTSLTIATGVYEFHQVSAGGVLHGWVTMDMSQSASSPGVLRVHRLVGDSLVSVVLPESLFQQVVATATIGDKVFVTGPVTKQHPGEPPVRSQLLSIDWQCRAEP